MYQKRNNELEIMALFSGKYEQELYLREISRLSRIPLKTVQNALSIIEKKRVLKSVQHGKNRYFSLNRANIQTKLLLLQAEIHKTSKFLGRYPQFSTFLKEIKTDTPIIVFGSFARFAAGKNSDVDILTISEKEPKLPAYLLPNKIHLINISKKGFTESLKSQEAAIKEIEASHVILNGHSQYVNAMWNHYGKQ